MRTKQAGPEENPITVVANNPELQGRLQRIGGSRSDAWNNMLANQAVSALWTSEDADARSRQYAATVAALAGIGPKDEIEGMIAAQLIAAHCAAMECYRRAMVNEQTSTSLPRFAFVQTPRRFQQLGIGNVGGYSVRDHCYGAQCQRNETSDQLGLGWNG
jgi:hypothetical protein